ncbi:MAG TPA: NAD(P)H-dependent oxidoreductase [Bryocella sp.]|nr:NAD(P)H-dependent oxidoreductase [Bryocella sp.]
MPTLLHLDVSPRGDYSVSRHLSKAVAEDWKKKNPGGKVIYRDLSHKPLPFVDLPWIAAAYSTPDQHTPEQQRAIAVSNELVDEVLAADEILIGSPMFNFNIPAALKGWVDHIVRLGRTFNEKYEGLATGKKARIAMASMGTYTPGAYMESANFFSPYMKFILGFIGIKDVDIYLAGGTSAINQGQTTLEAYLAEHTPKAVAELSR